MAHLIASHKRAKVFSLSLFLVGLAIVTYLKAWWPGIMLVFGVPIALREYLLGRPYDAFLTAIIFIGAFLTVHFEASWEIILPIIFVLGAIYVFFRDFTESQIPTEEETDEDLNHEIEEEK